MKSDNAPPESKDKKLRYETPVLMPLGEMARGYGAFCSGGGAPGGGSAHCQAGGTAAAGHCRSGTSPGKSCGNGGSLVAGP